MFLPESAYLGHHNSHEQIKGIQLIEVKAVAANTFPTSFFENKNYVQFLYHTFKKFSDKIHNITPSQIHQSAYLDIRFY